MSKLPLDRLIEYYKNSPNNISEGIISDVIKKFGNWIKQKARSLAGKIQNLFVRKIAGKNYLMYSSGGENITSGTEVGVLIKGEKNKPLSKGFAAFQNNPSQMTIAFREPHISTQIKENNFLSRLNQELNEAGRGRPIKIQPTETAEVTQKSTAAEEEDNTDISNSPYLKTKYSPTSIDKTVKAPTTKSTQSSFVGKLSQSVTDPEDELFTPENMNPALDYDALESLLSDFLTKVHLRGTVGGDVPSVLIQGFPGWGKTNIIRNLAKKAKMNLQILEIASLPTDYLQGLPAIEKKIKAQKTDQADISQEEARAVMKFIEGVLPPSGDINPWILFLDEFNVNEERMKAAMNLILSGSIGTAYELPKKTLVVVAGNLGEEIDGVPVQQMHAAVFDRFDSHVFMKLSGEQILAFGGGRDTRYDAYLDDEEDLNNLLKKETSKSPGIKGVKSFRYAEQNMDEEEVKQVSTNMKEIGKELTKFPNYLNAIQSFIEHMNKEHGKDWSGREALEILKIKPMAGYLNREEEVDDPGTTLSPRRLEKVCDIAKIKAVKDWFIAVGNDKPLPVTGKSVSTDPAWYIKQYEKRKEELKKGNILSPIALYLEINQWDKRYLPSIFKNAFGGKPTEIADKIKMYFRDVKKSYKELDLNIVISDFKRLYDNGTITDADVDTLRQAFSTSIITALYDIGNESNLKKLLKSKGISEKDLEKYDGISSTWVAVNITKFFKVSAFGSELAKAIIGNFFDKIAGKEESKYTATDKFVLDILLAITDLDNSFEEAWNLTSEIIKEKAKDTPESIKAQEFVTKGQLMGDDFEFTVNLDKKTKNNILYVLNMIKLDPSINKSIRKKQTKSTVTDIPEEKIIEIGFKNLLEKLIL